MAQTINVRLNKGEAPSLGFRLQGGKDFGTPLLIQKVNIGSPAEKSGLLAGDSVIRINSTDVYNLRHKDAQDVIIRAGPSFEITVQRGGSTWKPAVIPTGSLSSPAPATVNSYSPVTKTSLAAKPQPSIGAIGTGHNLAAKPFAGQVNGAVNGAPKLVNKQYNSPVGLYSEQSIAETLSAQAEVLSTGVLGVNFKKNEKNYDASNSAVFRMVQEADKEPRDQEPEPDSGVVTAPIGVAGLRRVAAPETKPAPTTPQLPPGQNICAECERLIVGVFVRIKDKNLHIECFKCSTCGTSLKNVGYYNINSKLYCDVHAKLAARSNPAAANLAPVTVPPGNAPAGTISAALSTRPLPTSGLLAPLSPGSNVTAQPFQQQEIIDQVTQTELDCVTKQNDDDVVKLFKNVTLAASRRRDESGRSGETTFVSEKVITINNDYAPNTIKVSGPTPYSAYKVKTGTNVASPRPFSSVTSPLSPSINSYSSVPKPAPVSAPFSAPAPASDRGRSIQNIVWPPPAADESDFPTATPLYFPPPSQIRVPSPLNNPLPPAKSIQTNPSQRNFHPSQSNPPPQPTPRQSATAIKSTLVREHQQEDILNISKSAKPSRSVFVKELQKSREDELKIYPTDYSELEELRRITEAMDPKMSFCSSEVTSIIDRRSAVEHIETMADTQMLVESVLHQRPRSPPPGHKYVETETKPKVEVVTEPKENSASGRSSREPRIVTRVCVCTEPCCSEGKLCESCPLRHPPQLKRPIDIEKQQALKARIDKPVPRRYGSPQITGVSVTINNPGRIRESSTDSFAQIPAKKSSTALASALSVAPAEPFTPVSSASASQESIPLPEETRPYLPPERRVSTEPKTKPRTESAPKPDTAFVSALKIAPERPFTPVDGPAPVRKKKPKEDPVLKDLPKPMQWMSMVSALTTASERPYSPFVVESSSVQSVMTEEVAVRETTVKESQQEILRRSIPNDMAKPYTKPVIREKYDPVHDKPVEVQLPFPPISDELKASFEYRADYSQIKSEISSQIIEQAHLEQETFIEDSTGCSQQCPEQTQNFCQKTRNCAESVCAKEFAPKQENVIAKQTETTILKKPLEISSYLHKPEYLPQYQMSLNYDETIQLPHHKDIRKLLPSDQNKQRSANPKLEAPGRVPPQSVPPPSPVSQMPSITRPVATIQPDESNPRVHQMSFQPVTEDRPPKTTFSPRPGSLTPSMINKPPPTLPYYQANLVATQHLAPEVNLFDPKSPAISRSPSPCPEGRSSSPFPRQVPRAVSPAPGPPPNPLKAEKIPTFTKEDRMIAEAKKNITAYIPQYREIVDTVQEVRGGGDIEDNYQSYQISVPTQQISQQGTAQALRQERDLRSETICQRNQQGAQQVTTQAQQATAQVLKQEHRQSEENDQKQQIVKQEQCLQGTKYTSVSESAQLQQTQQLSKSQTELVRTSADSSVQIQRRKMVSEEYEHTQKSKVVEVKQSSTCTGNYPFQKVNNPPIEEQGILGLHVTNPQPIVSPFLAKGKDPAPQSKSHVTPPPPPKRHSIPLVKHAPPSGIPAPVKPAAAPVCSAPSQQPPPDASSSVPTPIRSVAPPVSAKARPSPSASTNRPTVPLPNTGSSGGRQAGAIGVAPKRGRGVLNIGGLLGSRIALCGHCHSQIRGPFVTALGKIWCPEHFICATPSCRRQLADLGFVEEQGQLYCEYCFEQYLAPPCSKCNVKIKGDCLKAIGKNFHPECFNCSYCGKLFGNSPFFLEDGAPYCENDWNELFTTKCFACGFPVEAGDRWVEALSNNYHSQCFNCTMCKKNLEGQSFFAKGGRPFCKNHAR